MQNLLNVGRTAHWQTGIVSLKILSRSLKLALHGRPRKHMQSVQQTNLIPASSLHVSQHQPKITSSQQPEKKQQTGANTAKPCSTSSGMDSQKNEHDSEWTTASAKKTKHRIGKGTVAFWKQLRNQWYYLFHVWTQAPHKEKWKRLQTFISKKLKSTVKSSKQDITFMPLSKSPFKVSKWKMSSAHIYGPVAY